MWCISVYLGIGTAITALPNPTSLCVVYQCLSGYGYSKNSTSQSYQSVCGVSVFIWVRDQQEQHFPILPACVWCISVYLGMGTARTALPNPTSVCVVYQRLSGYGYSKNSTSPSYQSVCGVSAFIWVRVQHEQHFPILPACVWCISVYLGKGTA